MQMFSVRLAALRKECGLSQDDLAKIINKTRSAVSGYEIEDKEPSFELLCALAKYFNVSTDYLLGLSDERRHVEQVFYNDQRNFEEHFKRMPAEMAVMEHLLQRLKWSRRESKSAISNINQIPDSQNGEYALKYGRKLHM